MAGRLAAAAVSEGEANEYDAREPKGGPCFGWFSDKLSGYPETLGLKTMGHLQSYPDRPLIELEPTDHPLAVEQRDGVPLDRLVGMIHDAGGFEAAE